MNTEELAQQKRQELYEVLLDSGFFIHTDMKYMIQNTKAVQIEGHCYSASPSPYDFYLMQEDRIVRCGQMTNPYSLMSTIKFIKDNKNKTCLPVRILI